MLARWNCTGSIDDALRAWTAIEVDRTIVDLIARVRASGVQCHLATNQEPYRARHMRDVLDYGNVFDRLFFSCRSVARSRTPATSGRSSIRCSCRRAPLLFIDDVDANVAAAESVGIRAELFAPSSPAGAAAEMQRVLSSHGIDDGQCVRQDGPQLNRIGTMARHPHPVMILVAERKLADFISPPTPGGVLEASGVIAKGADYYVIFDNVRRIARIHRSLEPGSKRHSWFGRKRDGEGYEDIAFSRYTRRFYLLIEAEKHPDGTYKALIDECDESAQYKRRRWVDFAFEKRNTGFEGLSAVRWRGQDYLLALCEGNRCRAGRAGRKPGGGRIHLLQRSGTLWKPVARIKLPRTVSVRRLLGGRAARTPHRGPLSAILAALDWHASLRRLDDCRRGNNVRVSANEERQDQVPDARGAAAG